MLLYSSRLLGAKNNLINVTSLTKLKVVTKLKHLFKYVDFSHKKIKVKVVPNLQIRHFLHKKLNTL